MVIAELTKKIDLLVVEPTPKNIIVKMGSSSPISGLKIPKIFEVSPPRYTSQHTPMHAVSVAKNGTLTPIHERHPERRVQVNRCIYIYTQIYTCVYVYIYIYVFTCYKCIEHI